MEKYSIAKMDWFKVSILLILLSFLVIFYQYSNNGKYSLIDGSIINTRTGDVYTGQNTRFGIKTWPSYKKFTLPK
jgi:hypothetical protein